MPARRISQKPHQYTLTARLCCGYAEKKTLKVLEKSKNAFKSQKIWEDV